MKFRSEQELVERYQAFLSSKGIQTKAEVSCGKGFAADLVSETCVWECKLTLDREHLYQAIGQALSYAQVLGVSRVAVFGLAPKKKSAYARSLNLSRWLLSVHPNLWISFVDKDPQFIEFCKLGVENAAIVQAEPERERPNATPTERSRNFFNSVLARSASTCGSL